MIGASRSLRAGVVAVAGLAAGLPRAGAQEAPAPPRAEAPRRPVATYSIVARDAGTGQLGVAVQSHWFSVGPVVPWARAGVGAVATQSFTLKDYGPGGLALMAGGTPADEALAALLEKDEDRDLRQVGMVDARGRAANHTGARCIAAAGGLVGDGFCVQANIMEKDTVWPAMAAAYEAAEGDLATRLLAALRAAEAEGGDLRGRQSAAILVVSGERGDEPWQGRLVELRVEDHPDPLGELARLLRLHRAYAHMDTGDALLAEGDTDGAVAEYASARDLVPDSSEIAFWSGVTLASVGRLEEARPLLRQAYAGEPRLRDLVSRLPASGLLAEDLVEPLANP